MAVWVDCQTGPSYFGGFACDMGPYIGPWPMLATGEITGLGPWDEIDFVLGFPNTAHPGDAYYGLDGTYDSPIWLAYRYTNGGTPPPDSFDGSYTASVGAATDPGPTDTPPPGMHLYVVAYVGSPYVAPANPPEFYVPATYCAAGASALQTNPGGWSAWQPSLSLSAITPANPAGSHLGASPFTSGLEGQGTTTGSGDIVPLIQSAVDGAMASGASATRSGVTSGGLAQVTAIKTPPDPFGPAAESTHVTFDQFSADFVASPSQPFPPPLSALTPDVDYADAPWYSSPYAYEDPTYSDFQWGTLTLQAGSQLTSAVGDAAGVGPLSFTVNVDLLASPVAVGSGLITSGTRLASLDLSSADYPWGDTFGNDQAITFPTGLPTSITVAAAAEIAYTGTWDTAAGPDFSGNNGNYSFAAAVGWGAGRVPYTWETGRWRYWRPNTIGPSLAWHTVAGSWASISGAPMAIFTPGLGPVDYADGPA